MARAWNGSDLLDELTALLGDTSTTFRGRCLGWMNDIAFDISTRHDWGHHLVKGKKTLVAEGEIQSLEIAAPSAPTVALVASGSLTASTAYRVLVTYLQAGGVESIASTPSEIITTTTTDLSISLDDISTSIESTVISRRIYLQKAGGSYLLHGTLDDNFATSYSITSEPSSTIEPPDYDSIRKLKGAPFFETSQRSTLIHRDVDQLRHFNQGAFRTGQPQYFSPIASNSLVVYPLPSEDMQISFNYYRNPFRMYDSVDSQPDLPISMKTVLKAGVVALGYEYRDRDGQENKRSNYEQLLMDAINRSRIANVEYSVRDVYGDFNGNEVG